MKESSSGAISRVGRVMCLGAIFLTTGVVGAKAAWAEDPPPPPPPAMDAPPPAMPMMPPPAAAPPMAAPPSAVAAEVKPPTAAESMPASRPEVLPPIDVGAWTRIGGLFQNGSDPSKIDDFQMKPVYVELHAGGKIHKKVGVTLNLNSDIGGYGTSGANTSVQIMDAIVSFDFVDEFHVWAGHLLVPVDRANASGPFFMIPWNYPGFFSSVGAGAPKEGPSGRSNGVVVWGDVVSNKLTYLLGVFDNGNVGTSPLYSGRLRLALWDTEPGFWGNGSFFGDKDILSFGVGGQFQSHGSSSMTQDKDWAEVNVDALLEKKIAGGGFFTVEGAYYHFNVLDNGISDSLYALAAFATPTIGVGNIQPMVRYQFEKVKAGTGPNPFNIDAAVSYLIKGPALRLIATYSYTKLGTTNPLTGAELSANSIQLGAQAIFF